MLIGEFGRSPVSCQMATYRDSTNLHICQMLPTDGFGRSPESSQMGTSRDPRMLPIGDFSCTSVKCCQLATFADPEKVAKWQLQKIYKSRQLATSAAHLLKVANWQLLQIPRKLPNGDFKRSTKVANWQLQQHSVECCQLATFADLWMLKICDFGRFPESCQLATSSDS